MRYLILIVLLSSCAVSSPLRRAKAVRKIEHLKQRQQFIAQKFNIGTKDTIKFDTTIISGGKIIDTVFKYNTIVSNDTLFNDTGSIKVQIIRLHTSDTVKVPYKVYIKCPTDTIRLVKYLPCPEVKISKWQVFYSNALVWIWRWWWILLTLVVLGLLFRIRKIIYPAFPF